VTAIGHTSIWPRESPSRNSHGQRAPWNAPLPKQPNETCQFHDWRDGFHAVRSGFETVSGAWPSTRTECGNHSQSTMDGRVPSKMLRLPVVMKRYHLLLVLVLVALLACPLIRTALRYLTVQKVLSLEGAQQRMSIVPKHGTFAESSEQVQSIDLGYAKFDIGFTGPVSRVAVGSSGTCVLITNTTVHICFLAPFAPQKSLSATDKLALSGAHTEYPRSVARIQEYDSDPVQAQIRGEDTQVTSLWELTLMTKDQFIEYSIHVLEKAGLGIGRNEVISFATPYSKGLTRIVVRWGQTLSSIIVCSSSN
jgi:hypothetical protein